MVACNRLTQATDFKPGVSALPVWLSGWTTELGCFVLRAWILGAKSEFGNDNGTWRKKSRLTEVVNVARQASEG